MAINLKTRIANLIKKHRITDVEAEAVVDKTLREGKKEGLALLGRIKRKEVKIMRISYEYKEPTTPEEKQEQQLLLDRVYFPIFDQIMREKHKKDIITP